ncbi:IL-6 subfamily cytokine M17 [Astyanax mexicanus]|uniref:Ciliary neurotrophic factor n=1 Tax=Astyanax mexicanus TaxID=7994 RepID=A0A3B1J5Q0_ASTMX|nr:IL-6 subfamily cytokine M17 [Astyanax mexicanus]
MNGHDKNMLWQVHRSQSTSMVLFLGVILFIFVDLVNTTVPCSTMNCNKNLHKGVKLAKLMNRTSAELVKTYQANQGDFAEQFCKTSMDNVPTSTLSGQTPPERVLSIYTHLKEFLPHLMKVQEQQNDLQPPSSPLLRQLTEIKDHVSHLSHKVNCIFQTLQPNIPVPEPPVWPTRIPPAQNVFQQKVYGCVVLTRLSEFLSKTADELRLLKNRMCKKKRTQKMSNY